jgi:branched-chain amino acid transport system permease protein
MTKWAKIGATAAVAVIAVVLPFFLPDLTFYVQMVLAALVVTGLSLFMGYAGQASLGQGAFVAAGALTVAVTTVQFHWPPLLSLICAPIVAAAFAYLVGLPLLRLRGHYLAFATLALLLIVQALVSTLPVFGGGVGIFGIPPLGIGDLVITDQIQYAFVALAALALGLIVSRNLITSRFGRGVRALAGSESAAESSGVDVVRTKLAIFAVAAAFAGLAGGISAFFIPYVSSDSFPALVSFTYVIMAVVGGLGTLWGGVVGAVLLSVLAQALTTVSATPGLPPTAGPILQYAAYAVVLIVALIFVPRGVLPTIASAWAARREPRRAAAESSSAHESTTRSLG